MRTAGPHVQRVAIDQLLLCNAADLCCVAGGKDEDPRTDAYWCCCDGRSEAAMNTQRVHEAVAVNLRQVLASRCGACTAPAARGRHGAWRYCRSSWLKQQVPVECRVAVLATQHVTPRARDPIALAREVTPYFLQVCM
jgi:hypothetical protein